MEVYRDGLVLYGCGDFLNDYEGIGGYDRFRGDLVLAYFATFSPERTALVGLEMVPLQVRRMRLTRPSSADAQWMRDTLDRISMPHGVGVALTSTGTLAIRWDRDRQA
jgi:poly-gamma-glutamate synthesis protein (capsule biosynthesis protein)